MGAQPAWQQTSKRPPSPFTSERASTLLSGAIICAVQIPRTGTYKFSFYQRTVGEGTVETRALIGNVTLCEDKARKETSDFAPCEAEVNLIAGVTIFLFKATANHSGTPAWIVDDVSLVPK
jgi:hypothetical protein